MINSIELSNKEKDYVIKARRDLHQYPELSWEEEETSKYILGRLSDQGILCKKICKTGIVAVIEGEGDGPTIALRADMDALPIKEETGHSFSSRNEGIMHACGHDGHVAILLTVAKILNTNRKYLKGRVKLIFQPAEEVVEGAKQMLLDNVLEGVDEIVALHLWNDLERGTIGIKDGPTMASTDHIEIKIKGKGGHGSMPHQTIDSIVVGCNVVNQLQTIVSRKINPLEPVVISIGSFHAGTMNNIIPEEAILKGTVRCFSEELREKLPVLIEEVVSSVCGGFGAQYELTYQNAASAVINDKVISERLEACVVRVMGEESVKKIQPVMGSEDFAEFLKVKKGCIAFVGAKPKSNSYPHHHPCFDIDEKSLVDGIAILVEYIFG